MALKNLWWLLLLRGISFILFGIMAIGWPAITFVTLAFVFALYIIISGILNLTYGIISIQDVHRYWFLTIIIGLLEIAAGAYAFRIPLLSITAFVLLIGFTFVVRGIFEAITAFEHVHNITHKILMSTSGIIGVLAGLIILRYPVPGSLAFTWVLGAYALIVGSIYIALAVAAKEITASIQQVVK
jgi:uncharacterized membrane protein HdeD (DUF308 family)